ncbi:MAG: transposase [Candidatus Protistobacter heckmanni]|nr:transposase [Candidatus Protistobacter heckmanni]
MSRAVPPWRACPGYPAHLVARGNNRQTVFLGDQDRGHYLEWLRDAAREYEVAVHAYVLMENQVDLLVTLRTFEVLSRAMQSVARRHTQYFNRVHDRSGTLWEWRLKLGLIEPGPWLLACSRLIELKPVRAGLVQNPADYAWSSYPTMPACTPNPG